MGNAYGMPYRQMRMFFHQFDTVCLVAVTGILGNNLNAEEISRKEEIDLKR